MADLSIDRNTDLDGTITITADDIKEVILIFSENLAADTVINIQDGSYSGGGPAVVEGDNDIELPSTGNKFRDDTTVLAFFNGQQLQRGNMAGAKDINWASTTQISLGDKIKIGDKILLRRME